MKKITKAKYPDKTSINLAVTEVEPGNSKWAFVGFGVFLVVLLIFVKFAVLDPMSKAWAKESAYNSLQNEIAQMEDELKDYNDVAAEYSHYSAEYLTAEEIAITDRRDALDLMEKCVLNQADVTSVEITGSTMTIILSDTSLTTVSSVVATLQNDQRTSYVTVSTAAPQNTSDKSQLVSATLIVELGAEEDGTDADGTADTTNDTTESGGDAS